MMAQIFYEPGLILISGLILIFGQTGFQLPLTSTNYYDYPPPPTVTVWFWLYLSWIELNLF